MRHPTLVAGTISLAVILLQLVQTRVFGVVFWNHLVYFIISCALLGFGIAGTWLALGERTRLAQFLTPVRAAAGFAVTAFGSTFALPALGVNALGLFGDGLRVGGLLTIYATAALPYFFAGWILGIVFRDHSDRIHRLYFADLLGAGLGCIVFIALLEPLGAPFLAAAAIIVGAAPILLDPASFARRAGLAGAAAALLLVTLFTPALDRFIAPEPSKNFVSDFARLESGDRRIVLSTTWNPIARIDVVTTEKFPALRRIYMDGAAYTEVPRNVAWPAPPFDPAKEPMLEYALPYLVQRAPQRVLVIGAGGGPDVWSALRGGATMIDAVEINGTTARLARGALREANKGLFERPGVRLTVEDGRSFVRRSSERYDIIAMHAIDTFAAINAGAYVLSENYLYSVEAFGDYLARLQPGGIMSVSRWYELNEATRLFTTVLEALRRAGVADPAAHVLAAAYRMTGTENWVTVIMSPRPFTPAQAAELRAHVERHGGVMVYPLAERPTDPIPRAFAGYVKLLAEGRQERFFRTFPFDVRPNSDDSPFFFHYEKWRDTLRHAADIASGNWIRGNWPSLTLFGLTALSLVAVIGFIVIPLWARGGGRALRRFPLWALYFTCLGIGFIFVEIALMQRFALLLGHPATSLVAVLATLLIAAGFGSWSAPRIGRRLPAALAALALLIVAAAWIYPGLNETIGAQTFALRVALVIALTAPLGFLMGMAFPSGIAAVARADLSAVPWMWGINGGTTVLGSLLAIILAMASGFTAVLAVAAGCYALAALAYWRSVRP